MMEYASAIHIHSSFSKLTLTIVLALQAIVLCEYLEAGNVDLDKKNVIELGAGSGIVGIVSTLLGKSSQYTCINIISYQYRSFEKLDDQMVSFVHTGAHTTITDLEKAIPYLTEVVNTNLPKRFEGQFTVQALDWRENLESRTKTYDVILGADIIYIEETFPDLLRTIEHLSDENTLVYISCRIRYTRDSNFLQMLSEVFDLKKVHVDRARDITIYKGKKKRK